MKSKNIKKSVKKVKSNNKKVNTGSDKKVEVIVHPHGHDFLITEKGIEENVGSFKTYISPENPLEGDC